MRWSAKVVSAIFMAALVWFAEGCAGREKRAYDYMPNMMHTPAYKSFTPNPMTHDGMTLQHPVANTIARGFQPFHYGPGAEEAERAGRELQNPIGSTSESLAEGKALFETFCLVCHGAKGMGDGPLTPKIPNPPSYTSTRVLSMADGRIFHVITMGSGNMPSYASQITVDERWKIINYVRYLQQSQGARP